jgi:hypothetical protein
MEQYAKRLHEILEEQNYVSYKVIHDTHQFQVVHNICDKITVDGLTMNIDQLSNCHIPHGGTIHLESLLQLAEENPIVSVR